MVAVMILDLQNLILHQNIGHGYPVLVVQYHHKPRYHVHIYKLIRYTHTNPTYVYIYKAHIVPHFHPQCYNQILSIEKKVTMIV